MRDKMTASAFTTNGLNFYRPIPVLSAVLIATLAYNIFSAIQVLIRSMGIYGIGELDKIVNPVLLFLCLLWLPLKGRLKRFDALSCLLLFMLCMGTLAGLFHGMIARRFVSHFFVIIFFSIFYVTYYNSEFETDTLENIFCLAAGWTLLVFAISIAVFWWMYALGITRYPGFSCGPVMLALSYYIVKGNRRRTIQSLLVILLSGKRGVYLGMVTILFFFFIRKKVDRLSWQITLGFVFSLFFFLIVAVAASNFGTGSLPIISNLFNKMALLNPLSETFNPHIASSGRYTEILAAWNSLQTNGFHWLIGRGYGWEFEWWPSASYSKPLVQHYVHVAWLNFFFQYGLVVCLLFVYLLYRKMSQFYSLLSEKDFMSVYYVIFLFTIGKLVVTSTSYGMSRDALLWILLGLVAASVERFKRRPQEAKRS